MLVITFVVLAIVIILADKVADATSFADDEPAMSGLDFTSDDSFADDLFATDSFENSSAIDEFSNSINPANGLPMMGCVDIEGNAYGTDSSHWDHSSFDSSISDDIFSSSSMFDDSFSSSSMFDD